ncbi:MAG: pyridoxal phosphate-dependent aminotransferase [Calditrichaeota bacterium]|nr:MAG: pyridoxal phosphate-dependent aminotransferase [Calditrichota bacterium]
MPRFPDFSRRVAHMPGSVFEKFRPKMQAQGENLVRLHIGDSYLKPVYPLPFTESFFQGHEAIHRYPNTFGIAQLREALAEKLRADNRLPVEPEQILVTCGGTNALSAAALALLDPGEEILVLTPCWPLFFGMVTSAGARSVEVPFYLDLYTNPDLDIEALLSGYLTPSTAAIYVNTPNNPSGKMLTRHHLEQIARFARKHRLWIISDEAYDGLTYDNREHLSIASLPEATEQCVTVFTFSKIFVFAGLRLGYAVAQQRVIQAINKIMVHQVYSAATPAQLMMLEPVRRRHEWIPKIRDHFQNLRDLFVEQLKLSFPVPEGTYFLFVPLTRYLAKQDYWSWVEACLDAGVSIASGQDFGQHFADYIRLCFTGEPPDRLQIAIERLNRIFQ